MEYCGIEVCYIKVLGISFGITYWMYTVDRIFFVDGILYTIFRKQLEFKMFYKFLFKDSVSKNSMYTLFYINQFLSYKVFLSILRCNIFVI